MNPKETYPLLDGDNLHGVFVLFIESCLGNSRAPALRVEFIESPRVRGPPLGGGPPYPPKL